MIRRKFLALVGLGALVPACPRPIPGTDAGSFTPGSVISVITSIADVLAIVLPIIRPFLVRFVPEGSAKPAVLSVLDEVQRDGAEWRSVAATFAERGGDACPLYATTGALTDTLVRLTHRLTDAGVGWGADIEMLIQDLGLLTDRLVGPCGQDGGVDGGAAAASGRAGDSLRGLLRDIRARGVRTLPPCRPESL